MDKAFQTSTYRESVSLPTENGLLQEKGVNYMKGIWHKLSAIFVQCSLPRQLAEALQFTLLPLAIIPP